MRRDIAFMACVATVAALAALSAHGASIAYLNGSGVTDLSDGTAWDGGVPPGAGDVAVFDGTLPNTLTIPAGAAWGGMVRTNIANAVTFAGGPLTLGADGITCFTQNDGYHRTTLPSVVLSAAQTWTIATNKTIAASGSITGTGPLTITARDAWNILFYGNVEPSGGVLARGAVCFWVMHGAHFAQPPDMVYGTRILFLADATGSWAYSDVMPSPFVNNIQFSFGSRDGDTANAAAVSPTVTLAAGDAINGTDAANADRAKQQFHVQDTHVVVDGADLTGNSWFFLRSGSWTQLSGDLGLNYAAIVGRGASDGYKSTLQRLTLSGGTLTARRLCVGVANSDLHPAEVFVTGGEYIPTLPNDSAWTAAITVGQRAAKGETAWDANSNAHVPMNGAYASGRFEMTGGTVKTPSLLFGNSATDINIWDDHTASRFALRGGTLRLGANGIRPAACWNFSSESHYDCVLSGGTLEFYASDANATANIRLSDRDGGTSFRSPDGIINTRFTGSLYGPGGFRKIGPSTMRITGSNNYTGRTDVVEGSLYTGINAVTGMNAIWDADGFLGLDAGAQITGWQNRASAANKFWNFQNAGTIDTFSGRGYSLPTIAATHMNGHAELAFDGTRAMFVTGNADQPVSGRDRFTITCVLRVEEGAVGGGSADWQNATVVMGCTIGGDNAGSRYGLAINADGCLGCGMRSIWTEGGATITTNETLWSTTPVNDGKPHVVVWTWKNGGQHLLQVDNETWRRAAISNGCNTIRTRFIVGAGEQSPANTFRGTIADLRMHPAQYGESDCAPYARALGRRYGVEAFDALPGPPAASTETVPAATATWTAETLTQSDGQSVAEWPEKDGKGATSSSVWTFKSDLAKTILKDKASYAGRTESPVIARGPDGHKLVSFNGTNACMALTGSADTPASYAGGLTVAAVVRFTGYGSGGGAFTSKDETTGFLGESFAPSERQWLLSLSGSARVGACMEWNNRAGARALKSARRFLNDGELHVLVVSYPPHGSEGTMIFALDGVTNSLICTPTNAIAKTRILLGGAEQNSKARYAPVDVAEFRFWKNVAFTPGQIETLTRELCAKYNVYAEGYERWATEGQQRSKEVFVHAGASYGAPMNFDFTLWPDQTIWGDGNVVGRMYVAPGAAVKVTATNTLHTADVDFADGSILKVECGANGAVNPLSVTGDVWFPDGTVTVVVQGTEPLPLTPLLTWTGTARLRGATAFAPADPASKLKFRLDVTNRRLVVAPPSGTIISVR